MAAILEELPNCPICFDDITDINTVTTMCGHKFHCNCLIEHAINSKTGCPICREKLPKRRRKPNPLQLPQDIGTNTQTIIVGDQTFEVREQMINGLSRLLRIGPLGGNVYTLDTHIEIGFYNVFTNEFYHSIETIVTLNGTSECVRRLNLNGIERYVSANAPYIVYDINSLEEIERIENLSSALDIMPIYTPMDEPTLEDIIAQLD